MNIPDRTNMSWLIDHPMWVSHALWIKWNANIYQFCPNPHAPHLSPCQNIALNHSILTEPLCQFLFKARKVWCMYVTSINCATVWFDSDGDRTHRWHVKSCDMWSHGTRGGFIGVTRCVGHVTGCLIPQSHQTRSYYVLQNGHKLCANLLKGAQSYWMG